MHYPQKWKLDCFFKDESQSTEFRHGLEHLGLQIASLSTLSKRDLSGIIELLEEIDLSLRECDAFISCLQAQNVADEVASKLRAQLSNLEANFQVYNNDFDAHLAELPDEEFLALKIQTNIKFALNERRERALKKLPPKLENLITDLSVDGYHGLAELYPLLVSDIKILYNQQQLSFGQAENKLCHTDRAVREEVFFKLEKAWQEKQSQFAQVLNHIAGFRVKVYSQRGWKSVLDEPLYENRMRKQTLDAMWEAVESSKEKLTSYLKFKAKILKLDKLAWYDVDAPLSESEKEEISFDRGASMIVEEFSRFHPRMGSFARKVFEEGWIEAEDRIGKRPGGFCTFFPKTGQSRIFMTYSGTRNNLSTLAHELGHAYHNEMVKDLPAFNQHYRMNVAETASTFAEQIISNAFIRHCKNREEKSRILSERIERSIVFLMNIHARFLFETEFYKRRERYFLSAEELCELMQQSQQIAFCGQLSRWHPYFWASKLHFYITTVPFYNFPYTFGYLFSLGLFALSQKDKEEFAKRYDALLRDTGMMSVEDLAMKHLDIDLTKPDFWKEATTYAIQDVDQFT